MATRDQTAYDMGYFADPDDDAGILFDDFITALSVWAWMRPGPKPVSVREAAVAFGVTDEVIRKAADGHAWMSVIGSDNDATKQFIDYDGE